MSDPIRRGRGPASATEKGRQLIKLVNDTLRGVERDYTSGSLRLSVILLAIPMVLEMFMESLFAVVDIFFVSRLGAEAVAVVGLTEAVITLIYAVAFGFSMAVTAVIARRIGEGNEALASHTGGQVLIIGGVVSAIIGIVCVIYAEQILRLMGAGEEVVALGTEYTRWMLGGSATIIFLFLFAAIFRGAGDAIIAMKALWIANGINIVLDPCLIFGWGPFPELGLTGAAIATNIGRGIGALYLLFHLFYGQHRVHLLRKYLRFSAEIIVGLLKVSVGGVLQFFIATASWVFLMRIVAQFGSEAVAGYTIAIRIVMFTFLPAWGLSNAAATLVGQCLGADKPDRAEQSVWQTMKYNVIFMTSVGLVLIVFAPALVSLFVEQGNVFNYAVNSLRIASLGYTFYAIGMVMTQAFNGSGDTLTPTWINFICFWLIQIPLAYIAANLLGFGTYGVVWCIVIAESLIAVIAFWKFRKGHWKTQRV